MMKGYMEFGEAKKTNTAKAPLEIQVIEVNMMKGRGLIFETLLIPFYCPKGIFHLAEGRDHKRLIKDFRNEFKRYGFGKAIRDPRIVEKKSRFSKVRFVHPMKVRVVRPPPKKGRWGLGESIFPQYNPHAVIYEDSGYVGDNSIFPQYNPHAVAYDDPNYVSDNCCKRL